MHFLSIYPLLENFPDLKIVSLILAENPLFFPDFPDWKKFSKFSLISLIGGNPDSRGHMWRMQADATRPTGMLSCLHYVQQECFVLQNYCGRIKFFTDIIWST